MTTCQTCESTLVTDGLSPGQQIRCANCNTLSRFGKIESVATDSLAWRSFWLGISSIVLLTITGIPAVYYGVRSLLRMRFIRPKRRDRAAAIIGTSLGGCFGIFVGFIVTCSLIVVLIRVMTAETLTEPARIVAKCEQFFDFSYPQLTPAKASSALNSQYIFDFSDRPETEIADRKMLIRLVFVRSGLKPNEMAISNNLKNKRLGKTPFGSHHRAEYLDWRIDGEPINVKKSVFSRVVKSESEEDETVETHRQYWGFVKRDRGLYGIVVLYEPGTYDLSEDEIKEIFASTKLK